MLLTNYSNYGRGSNRGSKELSFWMSSMLLLFLLFMVNCLNAFEFFCNFDPILDPILDSIFDCCWPPTSEDVLSHTLSTPVRLRVTTPQTPTTSESLTKGVHRFVVDWRLIRNCSLRTFVVYRAISFVLSLKLSALCWGGFGCVCACHCYLKQHLFIRRHQVDLSFYGPDRPCFCVKGKNNIHLL